MKKVLYSLIALVLAGGTLAAVVFAEEGSSPTQQARQTTEQRSASVTNTEGLEKILNPSELRNFDPASVKRVGTVLWGKRKANSIIEKSSQTSERKSVTTTNVATLEKISHPSEVKNFVEIRRIGNALWGKRKSIETSKLEPTKREEKNSENKEVKSTENREPVLIKPEAVQCVKTAIDKKDTTLKAALSAQNALGLTAIDARNTCQKAALDKTTAREQVQSNKACLETYHQSVWDSLNALKQAKENGWKAYTDDLKACSLLQHNTTTEEKIMVEDGEMQINLKAEEEALNLEKK